MHRLVYFVLLSLNLAVAYAGSACTNLSGRWRNELGSVMNVYQEGNMITGSYRTAVESDLGAANISSNVTGSIHVVKDGSILGFTVLWNRGASLTAWVGQCFVCGGEEVIFTTYNLRRHMSSPADVWKANIVNQNTFWRLQSKDNATAAGNFESRGSSNSEFGSGLLDTLRGIQRVAGEWTSSNGDSIEFEDRNQSNLLQGKYKGLDIIAQIDGNMNFTAVGAVVASPKLVRVWTGHVDEKSPNVKNLMEMTWLQHSFNPSCDAPRKLVHFGMDKYVRVKSGGRYAPVEASSILEKIKQFFKSLF